MLIDLSLPGSPAAVEADVCIVGSGPAGMALAGEFVNSGSRVCLLEAGGRAAAGSLEPCTGVVDSPDGYQPQTLHTGRARQFGGSANLWKHRLHHGRDAFVRCLPLDAIDFEQRAWVPDSGWPFSKKDLQPFYERAQRIFGLGPENFAADLTEIEGRQSWAAGAVEAFASPLGSAQDFLRDLTGKLTAAAHLQVILHADLRRLELDPLSRRIVCAEAESSRGRKIAIRARHFVLAAGGLENPRILLLNQSQQAGGLGNQHDVVGRYFMDHPSIMLGTVVPASPSLFERSGFFDQHQAQGHSRMGLLHLREEVMRSEQMLNMCGAIVPHFKGAYSAFPTFWRPLAQLVNRAVRRRLKAVLLPRPCRSEAPARGAAGELLEGCYEDNYTGWSRLARKTARLGSFSIRALVEQAPDAANRVTLGDLRDHFDQPKIKLIWRWNEVDLRSIRSAQAVFQREFTAAGLGRFSPVEPSLTPPRLLFWSPHHFMGTTRMHRDERRGVVDENCRVHGIPNLFIAGSSVFPTGGYANPTLTIVALALRLADHLQQL